MSAVSKAVLKTIFIPSLITLAVTLLRLFGELRKWPELFFGRSAGGSGAIVGITWLAFVFAIYFAIKLEKAGDVFARPTRSILLAVLALALTFAGLMVMYIGAPNTKPPFQLAGAAIIIAAMCIMRVAWPDYWSVMIAYALAARLPVIVIMYYAIKGSWGTHYDALPPNMTFPDWYATFVQAGLIPQVFLWVPFTVVLCGLFGILTVAVRRRRNAA
jgi:hypothetical protein